MSDLIWPLDNWKQNGSGTINAVGRYGNVYAIVGVTVM